MNFRKDSFITHRAFCDALAEESARMSANQLSNTNTKSLAQSLFLFQNQQSHITWDPPQQNPNPSNLHHNIKPESQTFPLPFLHHTTNNKTNIMTSSPFHVSTQQPTTNVATSPHLSATALLQTAATVGAAAITGQHTSQLSMGEFTSVTHLDSVDHYINSMRGFSKNDDGLTRDFLGLTNAGSRGNGGSIDVKEMLIFRGGVEYEQNMMFKSQQGFGFFGTTTTSVPESWGNC